MRWRRAATPPPLAPTPPLPAPLAPTPLPPPLTQMRFHFDVATYEGKFAIEKELTYDMGAIDALFEFDFYGAERRSTRKVSLGPA